MTEVTITNGYGTMPLEEKPRSIFDDNIAGQHDTEGNYYCIHVDHKTHTKYAVSGKNTIAYHEAVGRPLEENEEAIFDGERVRGMTYSEECAWNEDRLMEHVDCWGNIAVDEPFDMEWYLEHCI